MAEKGTDSTQEITLHCYHRNAAPAEVVAGWRKLEQLPETAYAHFWELLGPALLEPVGPAHGQRLQAFSRKHGVEHGHVAAALHCCRLLLRQSSGLDLADDQFREDLAALSSGDGNAADMLLAHYPAIKAELRKQILQQTLADHGKVLVGLDWRLDRVAASQHGDRLDSQVVFLTLRCREADRLERISVQLTPDALQLLKGFCDRFVG